VKIHTICSLLDRYQRFDGTYCLHLQGENVSQVGEVAGYTEEEINGSCKAEVVNESHEYGRGCSPDRPMQPWTLKRAGGRKSKKQPFSRLERRCN
jgi:hypothetical protein